MSSLFTRTAHAPECTNCGKSRSQHHERYGNAYCYPKKDVSTGRTETLLAYYKNNPDEYAMLKGLVCMSSPFHGPENEATRVTLESVFDLSLIRGRMGELREANKGQKTSHTI